MSCLRRLLAREDGTAAIEFAFVGLLFITLSIGIVEVGRALFLYNELAHAADRAARLVMIEPDVSTTDLQDLVRSVGLTGLESEELDVASDDVTDNGISFRALTLSYPFTPMIEGLTIGPAALTTVRRVPR